MPRDPEQEESLVHEATQAVVSQLQAGAGVVVHCAGGTGRTGTVIGCVLRVLGVAAVQVISYLDHLHQARGRSGWPESAWQSQVVRRVLIGGGDALGYCSSLTVTPDSDGKRRTLPLSRSKCTVTTTWTFRSFLMINVLVPRSGLRSPRVLL